MTVEIEIKELEKNIGFPIDRKEITSQDADPYDEKFSYDLCQRFYGKENELNSAIEKTTNILLQISDNQTRTKSLFFSLLANMYYLKEDFEKSIGCSMKALSLYREDLTPWIELSFAIRETGEIELFETILFHLDDVYAKWKSNTKKELNKQVLLELLDTV